MSTQEQTSQYEFQEIYSAGAESWMKVLESMSPELAERIESGRLTLAHGLDLIGLEMGAFEYPQRRSTMRYMTDDDQVFDRLEDAEAHERDYIRVKALGIEVDAYVRSLGDIGPREVTRVRNTIMSWLEHDVREHPERYEEDAAVKLASSG